METSLSPDLSGLTSIVTGAAGGIGMAITTALLAAGVRVAAVDRDTSILNDTYHEAIGRGLLIPLQVDLTEAGSSNRVVEHAIAAFQNIDILVNNAGLILRNDISATDEGQWDRQIGVNLKSSFFLSQQCAAQMKICGWGRIINISSQAGHTGGAVDCPIYAISKGGLNTMTRSFARAYAQYGITVNAIAPGIVMTDMISKTISTEKIVALIDDIPIGRATDAVEIAALVLFLSSRMAGSITGHVVDISGGMVMR